LGDVLIQAALRAPKLELAVAITSDICREAQRAHHLATTSVIALGRLLTAALLIERTSKRRGTTSLQVLTNSRIKQIYGDVTYDGHARGFVKNADLSFPVMEGEKHAGRRAISLAVLPGKLSVVRAAESGQFRQSTVELVTGEIDDDVEHFLEHSDQIPTALACEVLMATDEHVELAGGVLVQALPGADLQRLAAIKKRLKDEGDGLAELLRTAKADAHAVMRAIAPDAELVETPLAVAWKCRCSKARVIGALKMLRPEDLAEMLTSVEPIAVSCDLCAATYMVEPTEIEEIFRAMVKAEG
jgi:molecular chaperone Hsp33